MATLAFIEVLQKADKSLVEIKAYLYYNVWCMDKYRPSLRPQVKMHQFALLNMNVYYWHNNSIQK